MARRKPPQCARELRAIELLEAATLLEGEKLRHIGYKRSAEEERRDVDSSRLRPRQSAREGRTMRQELRFVLQSGSPPIEVSPVLLFVSHCPDMRAELR